jgi:hypothetical protein
MDIWKSLGLKSCDGAVVGVGGREREGIVVVWGLYGGGAGLMNGWRGGIFLGGFSFSGRV